MTSNWTVSLAEIMAHIPSDSGETPVHYGMRRGSMRIGIYAPRDRDDQSAHTQDELYIVVAGTGMIVKNGERRPLKPQDVIFVEAGAEHRFEDFSADFSTWVIFWGPKGGEGDIPGAAA